MDVVSYVHQVREDGDTWLTFPLFNVELLLYTRDQQGHTSQMKSETNLDVETYEPCTRLMTFVIQPGSGLDDQVHLTILTGTSLMPIVS